MHNNMSVFQKGLGSAHETLHLHFETTFTNFRVKRKGYYLDSNR